MRFKYLTATMLREAACLIEQGECECICWAIDMLDCQVFTSARKEFERLLVEMGVSNDGWLDYQLGDQTVLTDRKQRWFSQEQRITRAFFLHMLADAIAYKAPKRQKFDGSNKPFSKNPSEPGVYAAVPIKAQHVRHYSKWDGEQWCLTDCSVEAAYDQTLKSHGIYRNLYSHWINTKLM